MNSDYPVHTPELARLFKAMNDANDAAVKAARRSKFGLRTPEYKAAMVAYRAYWSAVTADKDGAALAGAL